MPTLDFTDVFAYRPLGLGEPAPVLPIEILAGGVRTEVWVLVDTGAEETLLDGMVLRSAGVDLLSGQHRRFQGFMGASTIGFRHRCTITVGGLDLDLDLCFSSVPLARQVLGRDVMQHFVLAFRERTRELYLAADPLAPRAD